MMMTGVLESKSEAAENLLTQFFVDNDKILSAYFTSGYVNQLKEFFETEEVTKIHLNFSALQALLAYQLTLINQEYEQGLITQYVDVQYTHLKSIATDENKIREFTDSVNYLIIILEKIYQFSAILNTVQKLDFFKNIYLIGTTLISHFYELIQPYFFDASLVIRQDAYQFLSELLNEVIIIFNNGKNVDVHAVTIRKYAKTFIKNNQDRQAFVHALMMFTFSLEAREIIVEENVDRSLGEVLEPEKLDDLKNCFKIVEKSKTVLILDAYCAIYEYFCVITIYTASLDQIKEIINIKYEDLKKIYKNTFKITAFNQSLSYVTEIFLQFNELYTCVEAYCKDSPVYSDTTAVCKDIYLIIKPFIYKPGFIMDHELYEKLIKCMQYLQHIVSHLDTDNMTVYLDLLSDDIGNTDDNFLTRLPELIVSLRKQNQALLETEVEEKKVDKPSAIKYVPRVVNTYHLINGNLYHPKQKAMIEKLNLKIGVRTKKSELKKAGVPNPKWDVVRTQTDYVSIYRGKNYKIGNGNYGITKAVQHFNGQFDIIKIIPHESKRNQEDEIAGLKSAGQFVLSYFRKNKSNESQQEILMSLVPGVELHKVIIEARDLSPIHWINIAKSMSNNLYQLHRKNRIHGDLHLKNCIIDLRYSAVKFVDFGLSLFLGVHDTKFVKKNAHGENNPYYMAPECANGHFGYATDIYSLGIAFIEIFDLGEYDEKTQKFVLFSDQEESTRLKSLEYTAGMRKLVEKMISAKNHQRPSMIEIILFLETLEKKYENLPETMTTVGYVELDFFISLSEQDQSALLSQLKKRRYYVQIQQIFEDQFIFYKSTVLVPTKNNIDGVLAASMKKQCGSHPEQYDFEYFSKEHVSGIKLNPPQETLQPLNVTCSFRR